ncbi:Plasmodium vivax Vir protein, putative [Plasmodium vivax]|uniref:Vir protein, putative n=1 Tax=Plasmodium vivax TaxID=5855 RepID=A0A1G4E995_PLAVI|nr:Plasmodium vivax Vir protein, putative [Plasmodium vivax]
MAPAALSESKTLSEIDLSYLTTQRIYNEMNTENEDLSNYSTHCEKLTSSNNDDQVKGICKKYLRYLAKSSYWKVPNPQFDVCRLLNYWMYDKLTDIFRDRKTSDSVNFALSDLQYIWEYTVKNRYINTYYKDCKPEFDFVDHTDWEKIRQLYEYNINYNDIKGLILFGVKNCESYYEYIEEIEKLYEHFQRECPSSGLICQKFYNNSNEYNPKKLLELLPCYGPISTKRSAAATRVLQLKESSSHHPEGSEPRQGASKDGPGQAESEFSTPVTQITHDTSDIRTNVANSVLGAAPVLFTATMLYRAQRRQNQ